LTANGARNNILWVTTTSTSSTGTAGASGSSGSKKKRAGDQELSFFDDSFTNGAAGRRGHPAEDDELLAARGYDVDALLQEDDIVDIVGLPGGRTELWQVLKAGALARDELIRSNLRLVSNIALQYCRRSVSKSSSASNNNIDTMSSSQQQDYRFGPSIYSDGWDRPSIYEAFQEGVVGLITAVERFEPSRNLRFSTFATFWITNYVRQSFQTASTGALRLPSNMHDKKNAYYALLKQYKRRGEVPPPLEVIAKSLGVTESRLITILRVTKPLRSMDEPLKSTDPLARNVFTMVDAIPDDESLDPEELVDLSLLRQSLESLMAGVLAPHERDILRLRLGLDDGVDRSISDVVNVYDGRMTRKEVWTTEQMALRKLRIPMILERYQLLDAAAQYNE
jgi:RNA polymerase primary sigma factor